MTMHIDYAIEVIEYHERNFPRNHNETIVRALCTESELLKLAIALNDEKITGICATVKEIKSSRHRRVTDKQIGALQGALLKKYGTARAIIAAAFNVNADELKLSD